MIWQWLAILNQVGGFVLIAGVGLWLMHEYGVVSGLLVLLLGIGIIARNSGGR